MKTFHFHGKAISHFQNFMKQTAKVLTTLVCAATLIISCSNEKKNASANGVKEPYDIGALQEQRKSKDIDFQSPTQSPIPQQERAAFHGLIYYMPEAKFAVLASFEKFSKADTITMLATKANDARKMIRYGEFSFTINGKSLKLIAYKHTGEEALIYPRMLFLPFTDETNGNDTYEGGRYLETLETPNSKDYLLDFNQAYNPYCAYNPEYSCPVVPKENHLAIKIEAGEKKYH